MNYYEAFMEVQNVKAVDNIDFDLRKLSRILTSVKVIYDSNEESSLIFRHDDDDVFDERFFQVMNDLFVQASQQKVVIDADVVSGARLLCQLKLDPGSRTRIVTEACIDNLSAADDGDFKTTKSSKFDLKSLILDEENVTIRANKTIGAYESLEEYLDCQRTLITEDFFIPLRKGLKDLANSRESLYAYGSGKVTRAYVDRLVVKLDKVSQKIDWAGSGSTSRLIFGSLVVLELEAAGKETTSFWTVIERTFNEGNLEISLSPCNKVQQAWPFEGQEIKAVYESVIYYEAYHHVIRALYSLRKIPFEDALVKCDRNGLKIECSDVVDDLQMRKGHHKEEAAIFSSSADLLKALNSPRNEEEKYERFKVHQLLSRVCNESQLKSIKSCLSCKIGLIQGPPGTGKSYVGTLLAKLLVSNLKGSRRPLVVICFTNHALDTFLESLLEFSSKIIRIGGRSKSTRLEAHNLTSLKRSLIESGTRDKRIYKAQLLLFCLFPEHGKMNRAKFYYNYGPF